MTDLPSFSESATLRGRALSFPAHRVLHHGPDLLVIDKPPQVPVHGGDERLGVALVTRLGDWLKAQGEAPSLAVHHRLDQEVSGVLLFGRDPALNGALSRAFADHTIERRYLAAVAGADLPDGGTWEHRLEPRKGGPTRIVSSGGKVARTRYRVLHRQGDRALVELTPLTGRTHQLRVQLAAAGAPVAGDAVYGGAAAPRLMLHAVRLAVPELDRAFEAPAPAEFAAWVRGEALPFDDDGEVRCLVLDALFRRGPLVDLTDAFRVVNGAGDGLPGITVDRFGAHAVLSVERDEAPPGLVERVADACLVVGFEGVYLKERTRADLRKQDVADLAPERPVRGEAAADVVTVREGSRSFRILLSGGLSVGLFLDQRDNRDRVQALAGGGRVLNLFSYTGSFSVAAGLGGAREITTVDLSRRVLDEARLNFQLNGLDPEAYRFIKDDCVDWVARARRRGDDYDLIILDPPSFGSRRKGAFSVASDLRTLAEHCLAMLSGGGRLLAVTNHRKTSLMRFRKLLREAGEGAGVELAQVKDLASGLDCPARFGEPHPSKSVLVTVARASRGAAGQGGGGPPKRRAGQRRGRR